MPSLMKKRKQKGKQPPDSLEYVGTDVECCVEPCPTDNILSAISKGAIDYDIMDAASEVGRGGYSFYTIANARSERNCNHDAKINLMEAIMMQIKGPLLIICQNC